MNQTLLVDILVLIVCGGITGFMTARTAQFLDFCMDYGHIFWEVRYWIAKKYAVKAGLSFKLSRYLHEARKIDVEERQGMMHGVYDMIAYREKWFRIWICPVCGSVYVSFLGMIVGFFILTSIVPVDLGLMFYYWISVFIWNYNFVR